VLLFTGGGVSGAIQNQKGRFFALRDDMRAEQKNRRTFEIIVFCDGGG
jgi:hypothetical protein